MTIIVSRYRFAHRDKRLLRFSDTSTTLSVSDSHASIAGGSLLTYFSYTVHLPQTTPL